MKEHIINVLSKGGVNVSHILQQSRTKKKTTTYQTNNNTNDIVTSTNELVDILESWLGLPEAPMEWDADDDDNENDNNVMMEDAAPFDTEFYRAVETFLIDVWNPTESDSTHRLFDVATELDRIASESKNDDDPTSSVSLYGAIMSIRVTRLLRYWMDLNVMGRRTMDTSQDDDDDDSDQSETAQRSATLSFQLLNQCTVDEIPIPNSKNDATHKTFPLLHAIYRYVESLPTLQSQIYLYTSTLTKGGPSHINRTGKGLANPQARLAYLQMTQQITAKLQNEFENHIRDIEFILGDWYIVGSVDIRKQCRAHLGSVWSQFETKSIGTGGGGGPGMEMENTTSSGIAMTLRLLHRILLGIQRTDDGTTMLPASYEHVLFHHLIPIHRPNSMVLWRDQTSLLDLYHEPLVQCIAVLLQRQPHWIGRVINGLMQPDIWSKGANTPKLVLLLHEIDTYIGCLPQPIDGAELSRDNNNGNDSTLPTLLRMLGSCMASENSRLAQRALPFVKNKIFVRLLELNLDVSLNILLPFLLRREPSWNPTVRKMTYNVLKTLQDFDPDKFVRAGDRCLLDSAGTFHLPSPNDNPKVSPQLPSKRAATAQTSSTEEASSTLLPTDYTIKSAMGSWKPPSATSSGRSTTMPRSSGRPGPGGASGGTRAGANPPPLGITGVAPWAMNGGAGPSKAGMTASRIPSTNQRNNPPLAITGVAPWAVAKSKAGLPTTTKVGTSHGRTKQSFMDGLPGLPEGGMEETETNGDSTTLESASSSSRVLEYMEKIKPPEEDVNGVSSWSNVQMAETPTLLPTLKFHNLVFGHHLGEGSFGSVRYARIIDRATTRSHWAEYAVKVISTERIKEMGYEASVQREIAVLRILSHPCIARLISSFRFREGVYLVLEYASGGDLHSLLKRNGSLDNDSTRFVIGEVISALASIHELGLVYADLKPENIVVTALGHVKLTDFGGCRPVTPEAKQMVASSAKNLLAELRDGDWKPREGKKKKTFDMDDNDVDVATGEDSTFENYDPDTDLRIEGTTIYLPPEVVMGAYPNPAADSWALGCVLYQCLTGRPPIIEADEAEAKNRIVSFDVQDPGANDGNSLFSESHAANVDTLARNLIVQLLERQSTRRPTMNQAAEHAFFQEAGMDVFTLYQNPAHPLDVGEVKPQSDAQWSRRQLSSIWAPQPQTYDISIDRQAPGTQSGGLSPVGPIPEGDEATAFFAKSSMLPPVQSATQVAPLPPRKKAGV